jgi:hypothetical protein
MIQLIIESMMLSAATMGLLFVVLATTFDIRGLRRQASFIEAMRLMTLRRQPHITIIVTRCENEEQLLEFLYAIKSIRYKKLDVVAVMNKISIHQRKNIYAKAPLSNLRIYSPLLEFDDSGLIANAYRRSQRGSRLMALEAGDRLTQTALKRAMVILDQDPAIDGVTLFGTLRQPVTLTQLYGTFAELSSRVITKASMAFGGSIKQPFRSATIYRYAPTIRALKSRSSIHTTKIVGLASEISVGYTRPTRWTDWALGAVFVVAALYSASVAAMLQSARPLIGIWMVVCLWLSVVVWFDESSQWRQKLGVSISIPVGMFVIVASYMVNVMAVIFRQRIF